MLTATMLTHEVVIKLSGSRDEFRRDLATIRALPHKDCRYDEILERWRLSHPEKYTHIPAIKVALQDRDRQLTFL